MSASKISDRLESRRVRLQSAVHQNDEEQGDDNHRGGDQLQGIEYGVEGNRYDEASVTPAPIDIANTPECFLATVGGLIKIGEPATGAMILYGPATYWIATAANAQSPALQQPINGLAIEKAEGTFEIVDNENLAYASTLEFRAADGTKLEVTSVLTMNGDLKDRDKDGYADSFKLDEVTGRLLVTTTDVDGAPEELLNSEYLFELRKNLDILSPYSYGPNDSGSTKTNLPTAMRSSPGISRHQTSITYNPTNPSYALIPPGINQYIGAHSGQLSNAYNNWASCVRANYLYPIGTSQAIIALACAAVLI